MGRNPLHTKLCDMLGIDFPIIAFTHCKDVVAAVVNAGGFAVLGEAMHTADEIGADIKWIRSRVGDKPFGIDLVLPASALFGATFVIACDVLARTVFAPVELPVGIVTALVGGPFFLWLLTRQQR